MRKFSKKTSDRITRKDAIHGESDKSASRFTKRAAFPRCKVTESLEKVFNLNCVTLSPAASIKTSDVPQVFDSVNVPFPKSLDH